MVLEYPKYVEETRISSKQIGHQMYETYLKGEPADKQTMCWEMKFRVTQDNRIQREFSIQRNWYAFSIDLVAEEAAKEGFTSEIITSSPVPTAILRL